MVLCSIDILSPLFSFHLREEVATERDSGTWINALGQSIVLPIKAEIAVCSFACVDFLKRRCVIAETFRYRKIAV